MSSVNVIRTSRPHSDSQYAAPLPSQARHPHRYTSARCRLIIVLAIVVLVSTTACSSTVEQSEPKPEVDKIIDEEPSMIALGAESQVLWRSLVADDSNDYPEIYANIEPGNRNRYRLIKRNRNAFLMLHLGDDPSLQIYPVREGSLEYIRAEYSDLKGIDIVFCQDYFNGAKKIAHKLSKRIDGMVLQYGVGPWSDDTFIVINNDSLFAVFCQASMRSTHGSHGAMVGWIRSNQESEPDPILRNESVIKRVQSIARQMSIVQQYSAEQLYLGIGHGR